jgi:uncharacterized protein YkwD
MRRYLLAVLSCAVSVTLLPGRPTGEKKEEPSYTVTSAERKFFEMGNEERKRNGLPPLKLNLLLCKLARAHSENMARQSKMSHVLDGKNQFDRMKGAGYRYRFAAENVARGNKETNFEEMVVGLMKSPLHRKNLLNKDYLETGVGLAYDGSDFTYYTQEFGQLKKPAK